MKPKNFLLTYLLTFIGGILLVIFNKDSNLLEAVVIAIGVLFIIASLLALATVFVSKKTMDGESAETNSTFSKVAMAVPSAAGLIFGILLVAMPGFFASWMIYTFAVMMIILGLVQFLFMGSSIRSLDTSAWYLLVPFLTIATGIICIVMGHEKVQHAINLITGIALFCYSINGLIGYIHREGKLRQHQLLHPDAIDPEELKDTDSDKEESTSQK